MKKFLSISIIPCLIFFMLSCALVQTYSEKTEDLLPRETEIPGWRIELSPCNFTVKDIREYIKKPEENRLLNLYGLEELSVVKYKNISNPVKQITVELFRMTSSLNAFGILGIERNDESREVKICEDSYSNSQGLFFRKGNYYIRIISSAEYTDSSADYEMFCRTICDKIKNTSDVVPDYLSLFGKKEGRSRLSYLIEGHLKLPDLQNIFARKIDISGKTRTVFFAKRDTSYISLGELSSLLKNKERQFILSSAGGLQIAFYKVKDNEFIFLSVYKEWIVGIFGIESMAEGEKTINILHGDLTEFLKGAR